MEWVAHAQTGRAALCSAMAVRMCVSSASVKGRPRSRKVAASGRSGTGVSVPPTNGANGCLQRGIFFTDAVLLKQTEAWRDYARPAHLEPGVAIALPVTLLRER
jgi:hypothetical protein